MQKGITPPEPFAIVAYDQNRAIGLDDHMLYDPRAELLTDNRRMWAILTNEAQPVSLIIGRTTLMPLLGIFPPSVTSIVLLTSQPTRHLDDARILYAATPQQAYELAGRGNRVPAVFGGAATYESMLPYTKVVLATELHTHFPQASVYFPSLDPPNWAKIDEEPLRRGPQDAYDASFVTYRRREP